MRTDLIGQVRYFAKDSPHICEAKVHNMRISKNKVVLEIYVTSDVFGGSAQHHVDIEVFEKWHLDRDLAVAELIYRREKEYNDLMSEYTRNINSLNERFEDFKREYEYDRIKQKYPEEFV